MNANKSVPLHLNSFVLPSKFTKRQPFFCIDIRFEVHSRMNKNTGNRPIKKKIVSLLHLIDNLIIN